MGEDVALFGGAYGVTRGLMQEFGEKRVLDTPISESALVGLAVGAAINGMRRWWKFSSPICCRSPWISLAQPRGALPLYDRRASERSDGHAHQVRDARRAAVRATRAATTARSFIFPA